MPRIRSARRRATLARLLLWTATGCNYVADLDGNREIQPQTRASVGGTRMTSWQTGGVGFADTGGTLAVLGGMPSTPSDSAGGTLGTGGSSANGLPISGGVVGTGGDASTSGQALAFGGATFDLTAGGDNGFGGVPVAGGAANAGGADLIGGSASGGLPISQVQARAVDSLQFNQTQASSTLRISMRRSGISTRSFRICPLPVCP